MKIIPHLWFDTQAVEAAEFYAKTFPESSVKSINVMRDTPSGDCDIVSFNVWGLDVEAISAGPHLKLNPSASFFVNFDPSRLENAQGLLDQTWEKLVEGGTVLMPLQSYDFSPHYGWVQDRFGVSWQLMLTSPDGHPRPNIVPSLLFVGDSFGQAKAATDHYLKVFEDSERGQLAPGSNGSTMFTDVRLGNLWLAAMDGEGEHPFAFNGAFSFIVRCDSQEEIDQYWEAFSADPASEECGWLQDAFGVSWQVDSVRILEPLSTGTDAQRAATTQAMLRMKKLDVAVLNAAWSGAR